MNQPTSSNWKAWHNVMPGTKPTLHVTGDVTAPTTGYSARLKPRNPQGINQAIYFLDLVLTPPPGGQPVNQVITTFQVRYEEGTDNNYTQVMIFPEKQTVDVKIVS
jgi:hypothetical protein